MRIFYKVLTVVVLSGLVCYTGRELNMQQTQTPTTEQAQTKKQPTITKQGDLTMNNTTQQHLNNIKETLHAAKDNFTEKSEKLWDKTKENSQKAAHEISEESEKIWDNGKEMTAKALEKAQNAEKKLARHTKNKFN